MYVCFVQKKYKESSISQLQSYTRPGLLFTFSYQSIHSRKFDVTRQMLRKLIYVSICVRIAQIHDRAPYGHLVSSMASFGPIRMAYVVRASPHRALSI